MILKESKELKKEAAVEVAILSTCLAIYLDLEAEEEVEMPEKNKKKANHN